jgi:hypothetical protein
MSLSTTSPYVSVYQNLLMNADETFHTKLISKWLIQLKYSKSDRQKDELKMKIFLGSSKLFVKAINNFFSLIKTTAKEKVLHSPEDIASECYMVMSNCVDNLDIKNIKKFYFYVNTSLNRRMYRLYERNYKKHFDIVPNTNENLTKTMNRGFTDHFDMSSVDLSDFTQLELDIIKFKYTGNKLNVFLKTIQISSAQYYENLELIKVKLIKRYDVGVGG